MTFHSKLREIQDKINYGADDIEVLNQMSSFSSITTGDTSYDAAIIFRIITDLRSSLDSSRDLLFTLSQNQEVLRELFAGCEDSDQDLFDITSAFRDVSIEINITHQEFLNLIPESCRSGFIDSGDLFISEREAERETEEGFIRNSATEALLSSLSSAEGDLESFISSQQSVLIDAQLTVEARRESISNTENEMRQHKDAIHTARANIMYIEEMATSEQAHSLNLTDENTKLDAALVALKYAESILQDSLSKLVIEQSRLEDTQEIYHDTRNSLEAQIQAYKIQLQDLGYNTEAQSSPYHPEEDYEVLLGGNGGDTYQNDGDF